MLSTSNTSPLQQSRSHHWLPPTCFAAAVFAVLVALYGQVVSVWWEDLWNDPNYSHVYIVPIISGFVVWRRWNALSTR